MAQSRLLEPGYKPQFSGHETFPLRYGWLKKAFDAVSETEDQEENKYVFAAEDAIALPRLIARNAFSEEEAQQRLGAQRKWTDRAAAADHIFHNDGSYEDFIAEVDQTFRETKEQHSAGTLAKSVWFAWREANPKPDATQS